MNMLPSWIFDLELWGEFLPLPVFSLLVAAVVAVVACNPLIKKNRPNFMIILGLIFALSLLGLVTGKIMGQSRDGAVGAVMPAILTLLGGLLVYVMKTSEKRTQSLAAAGIVGFTLCLAIGINWGAKARQNAELNALKFQENAKFKAEVQKLINDDRLQRLKHDLEIVNTKSEKKE